MIAGPLTGPENGSLYWRRLPGSGPSSRAVGAASRKVVQGGLRMRKFSSQMASGVLMRDARPGGGGLQPDRQAEGHDGLQGRESAVPAAGLSRAPRRNTKKPSPAARTRAELQDPKLTYAYFFLGNSYDNQFRPARRGEATNDAMLTKAIDNYKKAAEVEQDPKIKKLAMEYLVAAYGPDKLNDPSQAEPILRRMIELEPTEPSNYTYLSRIYEENGDYDAGRAAAGQGARDEAERRRRLHARWPPSTTARASSTRRWRRCRPAPSRSRTIRRRSTRSRTYYWEKAYRDFTISEAGQDQVRHGRQRGDRQGHPAEGRLHGGAHLQGTAAPRAGQSRKEPGPSAGTGKEAATFSERAAEVQAKQRAASAGRAGE